MSRMTPVVPRPPLRRVTRDPSAAEITDVEAGYLDKASRLKPFPATAVRLMEAVQDDAVEISLVTELIQKDPVLVAEVLRCANRASACRVADVKSVDEAVMALGLKGLAELAFTVVCGRYLLEGIALPEVAAALWRHSLVVGSFGDLLARRFQAAPGAARTLGLLHEIGRFVLLRVAPGMVDQVAREVALGRPLIEVEAENFGFDIGPFNARVAERLQLPDSVVAMMREFATGPEARMPEVRSVFVADGLASVLGYPLFDLAMEGRLADETINELLQDSGFVRELGETAREAARLSDGDEEEGGESLAVSQEEAFDALLKANLGLARLNHEYESKRREVEARARQTQSLAATLSAITMGLDADALRFSVLESVMQNYRVSGAFLVASEDGSGLLEGSLFMMDENGEADSQDLSLDLARLEKSTREQMLKGTPVEVDAAGCGVEALERIGGDQVLRMAPLMVRGKCMGALGVLIPEPASRSSRAPHRDQLLMLAGATALGLENARLYESVLAEAKEDPLTGLASRRRILDELDHLCARSERPLALLLIDLDHFKSVNDTLGHQQGDRYLKDVAKGMVTVIGRRAIIGRYGGDEFLAILPGMGREEALAEARKACLKVGRIGAGSRWREVGKPLGATVGVAVCESGPVNASALIAAADESLYIAKQEGRGRLGPVRTWQPSQS